MVIVVDIHAKRIATQIHEDLSNLPVNEPGLDAVVAEARGRNLFFTKDVDRAIDEADMRLIPGNTTTKTYGIGKGMSADLI